MRSGQLLPSLETVCTDNAKRPYSLLLAFSVDEFPTGLLAGIFVPAHFLRQIPRTSFGEYFS